MQEAVDGIRVSSQKAKNMLWFLPFNTDVLLISHNSPCLHQVKGRHYRPFETLRTLKTTNSLIAIDPELFFYLQTLIRCRMCQVQCLLFHKSILRPSLLDEVAGSQHSISSVEESSFISVPTLPKTTLNKQL